MKIETICRYRLPIVIAVLNNGGIYRGDEINRSGAGDPAPTILMKEARYDKLIEAFGGSGHHVTDPENLKRALAEALASHKPALINCVIDPKAGTESGHIQHLNPRSQLSRSN